MHVVLHLFVSNKIEVIFPSLRQLFQSADYAHYVAIENSPSFAELMNKNDLFE